MRLNNSTHMAVLQPLVNTVQIHGPKLRLLQASTIKILSQYIFPSPIVITVGLGNWLCG